VFLGKKCVQKQVLGYEIPLPRLFRDLWLSKSRPVDDVLFFFFFLNKRWMTHHPLYDKKKRARPLSNGSGV
jgi:hypothetical protein